MPPLGGGTLAAAAQHELQIAQIDKNAERLTDDEDRILAIQCVAEQHDAAADREHPERRRHDAAAGALGCDPLHDEAHREEKLRHIAEQNAPVGAADEYVMEIAANGLGDIVLHGFFPSLHE